MIKKYQRKAILRDKNWNLGTKFQNILIMKVLNINLYVTIFLLSSVQIL